MVSAIDFFRKIFFYFPDKETNKKLILEQTELDIPDSEYEGQS